MMLLALTTLLAHLSVSQPSTAPSGAKKDAPPPIEAPRRRPDTAAPTPKESITPQAPPSRNTTIELSPSVPAIAAPQKPSASEPRALEKPSASQKPPAENAGTVAARSPEPSAQSTTMQAQEAPMAEVTNQRAWLLIGKMFASTELSRTEGDGLRGEIEIGYRLPFARRLLGLSLAPSFGGAWLQSTDMALNLPTTSRALILSLPLRVSLNVALGSAHLFRALVGPEMTWSRTSAQNELFIDSTHTLWAFGFGAAVAYAYAFRALLLSVELGYRVGRASLIGKEQTTHALSLGAGLGFVL